MPTARSTRIALALAVLWFPTPATSLASSHEFKVVVHPSNPVRVIKREWLRDAFLRKVITWQHGPTVQPIDLAAPSAAREQFAKRVLQKTPASLRAYWVQRIFAGIGLPPDEVGSASDVIAHVLRNPGAVAYLPADADPDGAKVVDMDER